MGVGWAILAFFIPGLPQILHLDIIKALIIWFLPGIALVTGLIPLGGVIAIATGFIISSITYPQQWNTNEITGFL